MNNDKYRFLKYKDEAVEVETTVTGFVERNKFYENTNRTKNVFTCKSSKETDQLCILWDYSSMNIGDRILLKGRFAPQGFIAWNVIIIKRAEQNERQQT
ncbi:MAG: hypothetical protein IJW25_03285 [Clostridia bacterium]|nr:hypothetical protein [Clostridia bacterium]